MKISTAAFIAAVMLFICLPCRVCISAFCAVVIHEFGHIVSGRLCGGRLLGVSVCGLGAEMEFDRKFGAYDGILVHGGGMFFNIISASFALAFFGLHDFAVFSLGYCFINSLPISGLDGGGIFECVMSLFLPWRACDTVCRVISFVFLFFLWQCGIYILFKTQSNITPFLMCMTLFFELFCKI